MKSNKPVTRVIGYTRVSTEEQADSGLGLAAQSASLRAEADRRGWQYTEAEDAGYSGKNLDRPALEAALEALRNGDADVLAVAKLDRLSRSVMDFASLMERAKREGWNLVALDLGVDTTTPAGEMVATVMVSFAQYERRLTGQRTASALAAKRAAGMRLGRPVLIPATVAKRIARERRAGRSYRAIAEALNAGGIPTAQGGKAWHASTVRAVERRVAA